MHGSCTVLSLSTVGLFSYNKAHVWHCQMLIWRRCDLHNSCTIPSLSRGDLTFKSTAVVYRLHFIQQTCSAHSNPRHLYQEACYGNNPPLHAILAFPH